jgi:hypothetical protein
MRQEDAKPQFEALLREYDEVAQRVRDDIKRRDVLNNLIRGYIQLFPEFRDLANSERVVPGAGVEEVTISGRAVGTVDDRPRGQEAVRRVMVDSPGKWWTVGAMVKELEHRDWLPDTEAPAPAVRTSMERLAASPHYAITKDKGKSGAVTYRYRSRHAEEGGAD